MAQSESEFTLPAFLPAEVDFPDGSAYVILEPLTNYKINHYGTPTEASTVVTCRLVRGGQDDITRVMKIKVQVPDNSPHTTSAPETGPSNTTVAELEALTAFAAAKTPYAPHMVLWKQQVQGEGWPLVGGYITYIVMTMLPGKSLHQLQFWAMPTDEREEVIVQFFGALRSMYALGIEPLDRGLRNLLWDREARKCTIIDFELWQKRVDGLDINNETSELVKWGLAQPPITRDYINGFFSLFNSSSI